MRHRQRDTSHECCYPPGLLRLARRDQLTIQGLKQVGRVILAPLKTQDGARGLMLEFQLKPETEIVRLAVTLEQAQWLANELPKWIGAANTDPGAKPTVQ